MSDMKLIPIEHSVFYVLTNIIFVKVLSSNMEWKSAQLPYGLERNTVSLPVVVNLKHVHSEY